MGRRLALYSDILEKMSIGIDEYINYYSTKVDVYKSLSALKTRYENSKNGYEASLMISYDYDSKDFHEKNISKIKTELTVLKSNMYPIMYSNNKIKSTFQKLFFVPFAKKNRLTGNRISELEERLKKSTDAFEFYKNKYELGCNYLKVLGFENATKDSSEMIKASLDNTIVEFNSFIEKNGKYFENINSHDDFYKLSKSDIEDSLNSFMSKTIKLTEIKNEFETKKLDLETVVDAKKLLSDVNHQITAIIE